MNEIPPKKTLLVTGASGFLGWNICRIAQKVFDVAGVSNSKTISIKDVRIESCDVTRLNDLRELFNKVRPHAVIHAAAIADPNTCQKDPALSRKINVDASISIAGLCAELHIPCAVSSTDLVFDGTAAPYAEDRQVSPISVYGEQKVEAEKGMLARHDDVRICRMPLMYGDAVPPAKSFIHPFIKAMVEGKELALFSDEYRTPSSATNAAEAILLALENSPGVYHCGGRESISRYDFGLKLAKAINLSGARIIPVLQKNMVFPAPRPLNVSFDSSKMFSLGFDPGKIEGELDNLDCVKANNRI